jgi:hypothetical protein
MKKLSAAVFAALVMTTACNGDILTSEPVESEALARPTVTFLSSSRAQNAEGVVELWGINWPSQCTGLTYVGTVAVHLVSRYVVEADGTVNFRQLILNIQGGEITDNLDRKYRYISLVTGEQTVFLSGDGFGSYLTKFRIVPMGAFASMETVVHNLLFTFQPFQTSTTVTTDCL